MAASQELCAPLKTAPIGGKEVVQHGLRLRCPIMDLLLRITRGPTQKEHAAL